MKIAIFVLVLTVVALATAIPAKGSTKASLNKKPTCIQDCGDDFTPVCAGEANDGKGITFGNECVLSNYNCENKKEFKVTKKGECPKGSAVRLS